MKEIELIKKIGIKEYILDVIYSELCDAEARLQVGTMGIRRCINYLESEHGYLPPSKSGQQGGAEK